MFLIFLGGCIAAIVASLLVIGSTRALILAVAIASVYEAAREFIVEALLFMLPDAWQADIRPDAGEVAYLLFGACFVLVVVLLIVLKRKDKD